MLRISVFFVTSKFSVQILEDKDKSWGAFLPFLLLKEFPDLLLVHRYCSFSFHLPFYPTNSFAALCFSREWFKIATFLLCSGKGTQVQMFPGWHLHCFKIITWLSAASCHQNNLDCRAGQSHQLCKSAALSSMRLTPAVGHRAQPDSSLVPVSPTPVNQHLQILVSWIHRIITSLSFCFFAWA